MTVKTELKIILAGPSDKDLQRSVAHGKLHAFRVRERGSRTTKQLRLAFIMSPRMVTLVDRLGREVTNYEFVGLTESGEDVSGLFTPRGSERTKGNLFVVIRKPGEFPYAAL